MTGILAPPAIGVPEAIAREASDICCHGGGLRLWLERLWRRRQDFGITRIGSLTRLDRIGIPVVQVTRPLALSNTVSQGKGRDELTAAASGLMEAVETWAAERIPASAVMWSSPALLGEETVDLYAPWVRPELFTDWISHQLPWLEGYDLFSSGMKPVPLALVDTDYTYPSKHPSLFPRVTTGLGAGTTMTAAIVQAGLEILERDALGRTHHTPYYFERFQLDASTVASGRAALLLGRIRQAGLLVGIWRMPAAHRLPAYRCHVMEDEWPSELAPMPAEGSACRFTHEDALESALLEACQARLAAISGAREDITRRMYPPFQERDQLAQWREQLRLPGPLPYPAEDSEAPGAATRISTLLEAFRQAGAMAAMVVPLYSDDEAGVHVVRMVAPPLPLWPGARHG